LKPPAVSEQLSAVSFQQSAISSQQSAVSNQLSAISRESWQEFQLLLRTYLKPKNQNDCGVIVL